MSITVNPKTVTNIADNKLKQWYTKKANNMSIHYQIVLAPDEVLPFLEDNIKRVWDVQSFKYDDQNSLGFKHKYYDRIRDDNYSCTPVYFQDVKPYIEQFASLIHYENLLGKTIFGVVADVYVGLPTKKRSGIEKLINVHGVYGNSHTTFLQNSDHRGMSTYDHYRSLDAKIKSNTDYPDKHEIANEIKRDNQVLLNDAKTLYEHEFYEWDGQHKAIQWVHMQEKKNFQTLK
jgi:hypothetical protein